MSAGASKEAHRQRLARAYADEICLRQGKGGSKESPARDLGSAPQRQQGHETGGERQS